MRSNKEPALLRQIGLLGLTMSGIGSMVGSGWLFSAYFTAKLAGPAAILSWIIGGLFAMAIALTICELGSLFPKSGGMARYLDYTHGSLSGFLSAWANWLGTVAIVPIEAEASIQYMSSWPWHWAQQLYNPITHNLTLTGLVGAVMLILFYFSLNYWSLKLFVRFVASITILKIIIPALTAIMLIYSGFHSSNFTSVNNSFIPYGWTGVLTAIATCGIVMSFNGFQSPVNLAGEAKNPRVNLPLALIIGIAITLAIYLLLQIAFIGAISPTQLAAVGWHGINFKSPLAELALLFQLNFIALLLYFDSFVAPSGTGVIYLATTSRMLYGMERNGYMPRFLGFLHPKYRIPRHALVINFLISLIFLFCFRGWAHLVAIISAAHIISYIPGPISVGSLRRLSPPVPRTFKLPCINIVGPLAFVLISLLFYWIRWPLTGQVILVLFISLIFYFYYQHQHGWRDFQQQLKAAAWLIVYFIGLVLFSYCGGQDFGGIGLLSATASHIGLIIFSILIYIWGVQSAWMTPLLKTVEVD